MNFKLKKLFLRQTLRGIHSLSSFLTSILEEEIKQGSWNPDSLVKLFEICGKRAMHVGCLPSMLPTPPELSYVLSLIPKVLCSACHPFCMPACSTNTACWYCLWLSLNLLERQTIWSLRILRVNSAGPRSMWRVAVPCFMASEWAKCA